MTILKYDATSLGHISLFKKITGVDAKDCFALEDGTLIFVTEKNTTGFAVGREGKNIQTLRASLKKEIKIMETADNPEGVVTNFVWPQKPVSVSRDGNIINIIFPNSRDRRVLLSNSAVKLKQLKAVMKRYFPEIEDIKLPQ